MFDMTQCKIGDKLVTREGEVVVFTGVGSKGLTYPYAVETAWGSERFYGVYGEYSRLKGHCRDIVGFAPQVTQQDTLQDTPQDISQATQQTTIVAKPSFVLSFDGKNVTLTLDELKALSVKIINLIGEE